MNDRPWYESRAQVLADARRETVWVFRYPPIPYTDNVTYGLHGIRYIEQFGLNTADAIFFARPQEA